MKEFTKLTEKEIFELTDEQLDKYFKLEMANEGIPFMDQPAEPAYEEKDKPDLTLYTCNFLSVYFTDEKIVQDILNILKNNRNKARLTDYDYNAKDKDYREIKGLKKYSYDNEPSFDIITQSVYSEEKYISIKDINDRNKKRYENYEKLVKKYNENEEKRNNCRAKIYDVYYNIVEKINNIKAHKNKFKQYLELADGKKEIALAFYKKAYSIDKEIENEILK